MLQGREAIVHNLIAHIDLLLLIVGSHLFVLLQFNQFTHLTHLVMREVGMDAHELRHQIDDERLLVRQFPIVETNTHHTNQGVLRPWHEKRISMEMSIRAGHLPLLLIDRLHHALIYIALFLLPSEMEEELPRMVARGIHHPHRICHLDVGETLMQDARQGLFGGGEDVVVQLDELPQIEHKQLIVPIIEE